MSLFRFRSPPDFAERRCQERPLCLVVDDDAVCRGMVETQLRMLGLDAKGAGTAREAMAELRNRPPSFVLIDHGLPDGDGYGLARRIRCHERQFARPRGQRPMLLVTLSALAGSAHVDRCRAAGIDRVLTKPTSLPHLASALGMGTGNPVHVLRCGSRVAASPALEALYRTTCQHDLAALAWAVKTGDRVVARQLAHRIKGVSQMLGAHAVAGVASVLERADGDRAANADVHALALRWLSRLLECGQDFAEMPG